MFLLAFEQETIPGEKENYHEIKYLLTVSNRILTVHKMKQTFAFTEKF